MMMEETSTTQPGFNEQLSEALAAVITAAEGPPERAMVVDHIVEEIMDAVTSDPSVGTDERDSLSTVLDAADEHGERMSAFTS